MNSEEKYGKNYDIIRNEAKKPNKDLLKILLMSKVFKMPTVLDFENENLIKLKKSVEILENNINKENLEKSLNILTDKNDGIKGIGLPIASAFLHFNFTKIPIIDKNTFALFLRDCKKESLKNIQNILNKKPPKKFEIPEYLEYYTFFIKKYGDEDPREINFKLLDKGKNLLKSIKL